jgi:PAS domain S-box-containing protein
MNEDYLLVQSIKDYAIFMLDTEGYITSWNEGAKNINGYAAPEIIGKHFSIFYIEEDLLDKKPERELRIAMASGKYEEEGWRKRKDGSIYWANVLITAAFNKEEKHVGFSKITRDLTERKALEDRLRRSEERYRLLVEQVKDYGIFMLDTEGNITSWNEGAARINGYSTNEILGKNFSIFYPEEDKIAGKPEWELEVAARVGKYEEEGWRIRKNGDWFWVGVVITAIYNEEGKLYGFAKVTRDLTERKKAEAELKESFERYRLLAEELKQTNTQLLEVNHQLEQFASIASHDLKEPLRKIITFSDMLLNDKESSLSQTGRRNFTKVIESSRRMARMIEDILAFSSLTEKQEFEIVSLQRVLDETTELLEEVIEEKKAIVRSDRLPEIWGVPSQLRQMFQNLLSNSLKFSKKDETPQINITCEFLNGKQITEPGIKPEINYVQICFEDNGIGFDQKDKEKIFQLFKRLHTRDEYSGTGIGLSVVKKIVENHDGFISAQSSKDKGAGFKILLPVN